MIIPYGEIGGGLAVLLIAFGVWCFGLEEYL